MEPKYYWCVQMENGELVEFTLSKTKERCLDHYEDCWSHYHDDLGWRILKLRVEEVE